MKTRNKDKTSMFDDKLSEEELHDWKSSDLYDALKYGTREEVIACLKKLDRLDRELLEILVQQLEGSTQHNFRNRFHLVRGDRQERSCAHVMLDGSIREHLCAKSYSKAKE
jgi:hypothetical protein